MLLSCLFQAETMKQATLKAAKATANPLEGLPPAFCKYHRNGLTASIEHHTAATLPKADLETLHGILDENMAPIYGQEEWEAEACADKQKELLVCRCRLQTPPLAVNINRERQLRI